MLKNKTKQNENFPHNYAIHLKQAVHFYLLVNQFYLIKILLEIFNKDIFYFVHLMNDTLKSRYFISLDWYLSSEDINVMYIMS